MPSDAALPPYERIAADIEAQIRAGTLAPGDRLLSVATLAHDYDVNKNTVTKAIAVLKRKGLVESRQGWGTFIL